MRTHNDFLQVIPMIRFFRSALLRAVSVLAFATPALANVDIQHWTAANGARVYFVESHVLPILDVQVDFDAGSARDPEGRSGLAGMTHGLLDSGAGGLDEDALAEKLSDLGARLSGSADNDRAGLSREGERTERRAPRLEPQLLILSSGELTPFRLRIAERRRDGLRLQLSSDGFGLPRVEELGTGRAR